jgi:hypothetical protein
VVVVPSARCGGGSGPRASAGDSHGAGAAGGARTEMVVESEAGGTVGEPGTGFDDGQEPRPPASLILSGHVMASSSARPPLKLPVGTWSSYRSFGGALERLPATTFPASS